jgi:RNA polymerase sigma factor (sigma-70 family)
VRQRPGTRGALDPVEEVALVARAKRELLLRVHRHRLRREDLEDCFGQAVLELVAYARRGGSFADRRHLANVLEQRFLSRVGDRRRALSGRSPIQAALERAIPLDGEEGQSVELIDTRAELETLVMLRHELARVRALAQELSADQRLIIACQVGLEMSRGEFCERFGWSPEKYRKVAQRARARLRQLMSEERDVPPQRVSSEGETGTPYENFSPHS